jgi:hypothetical protein
LAEYRLKRGTQSTGSYDLSRQSMIGLDLYRIWEKRFTNFEMFASMIFVLCNNFSNRKECYCNVVSDVSNGSHCKMQFPFITLTQCKLSDHQNECSPSGKTFLDSHISYNSFARFSKRRLTSPKLKLKIKIFV